MGNTGGVLLHVPSLSLSSALAVYVATRMRSKKVNRPLYTTRYIQQQCFFRPLCRKRDNLSQQRIRHNNGSKRQKMPPPLLGVTFDKVRSRNNAPSSRGRVVNGLTAKARRI
ncbi:unnamed protein product [Ectocarpus sp. 8 AP-2014]